MDGVIKERAMRVSNNNPWPIVLPAWPIEVSPTPAPCDPGIKPGEALAPGSGSVSASPRLRTLSPKCGC